MHPNRMILDTRLYRVNEIVQTPKLKVVQSLVKRYCMPYKKEGYPRLRYEFHNYFLGGETRWD